MCSLWGFPQKQRASTGLFFWRTPAKVWSNFKLVLSDYIVLVPGRCLAGTIRPVETIVAVSGRSLVAWVKKFGLTVLERCWNRLIGFRNFRLGNWRFVCSLSVSAFAPVLCVAHLYHITPVSNLSSTGSWTPWVLTGKFRVYRLLRCDGLQWLGSSVVHVIVLLALLCPC